MYRPLSEDKTASTVVRERAFPRPVVEPRHRDDGLVAAVAHVEELARGGQADLRAVAVGLSGAVGKHGAAPLGRGGVRGGQRGAQRRLTQQSLFFFGQHG